MFRIRPWMKNLWMKRIPTVLRAPVKYKMTCNQLNRSSRKMPKDKKKKMMKVKNTCQVIQSLILLLSWRSRSTWGCRACGELVRSRWNHHNLKWFQSQRSSARKQRSTPKRALMMNSKKWKTSTNHWSQTLKTRWSIQKINKLKSLRFHSNSNRAQQTTTSSRISVPIHIWIPRMHSYYMKWMTPCKTTIPSLETDLTVLVATRSLNKKKKFAAKRFIICWLKMNNNSLHNR